MNPSHAWHVPTSRHHPPPQPPPIMPAQNALSITHASLGCRSPLDSSLVEIQSLAGLIQFLDANAAWPERRLQLFFHPSFFSIPTILEYDSLPPAVLEAPAIPRPGMAVPATSPAQIALPRPLAPPFLTVCFTSNTGLSYL